MLESNTSVGMGSTPSFPTTPGLPQAHYPDVTPQFNAVKDDMYRQVFNAQNPQMGSPKSVNGMLQDNFQPQGAWDLTSKPNFPGQNQYAQYKGNTVTGEFLNNHLFGMGMAASGQYPSSGLSDSDPTSGKPYPQAQLPQGISHPQAIASGYKSYHGDDSWQQQPMSSLADTSAPAPAPDPSVPVLKGRVEQTYPPDPESQQPVVWSTDGDDDTYQKADNTMPFWQTTPVDTSPDSSNQPATIQGNATSSVPPNNPMEDSSPNPLLAQTQMTNPVIQPPPYIPAPQQAIHPMISAFPTARMNYSGVPVHPVHAQEMAHVDDIYTQNSHPALSPVEISQWPKTQRFHQARAQQIQQQATWHPSQSQIQQRNFQMGSRGGFDNYPNSHEILNTTADKPTPSKIYNFPADPKLPLSSYPDVTRDLQILKNKVSQQVQEIEKTKGFQAILPLFYQNFRNGKQWDTKSLPNFPTGEQYALYKGGVVPGTYIANNFYGQISAAAKFSLPVARAFAEGAYSWEHRNPFARDQRPDEWAIVSGYDDYYYNDPWQNGKIVPIGF